MEFSTTALIEPPRVRWIFLALAMTLVACGGGGGGGVTSTEIAADFVASPTASAPDLVRLRPGEASGSLVTVEAVITGPTTSTDLYSFAFDLVVSDPDVAEYVPHSAEFGTALTLSAGQSQVVLASQSANRVAIGVSKTSGGSGNGVDSSEHTIVSLTFRLLRVGTTSITLDGSPGNPMTPVIDPAALDSMGSVIATVEFDSASAQLIGR